jgi:hypothetical protein
MLRLVRPRSLLLAVLILLVAAVPAVAVTSGFENPAPPLDPQQQLLVTPGDNPQRHDTPNDPNYDQAENDSQHKTSTNLYDERFDLFGFPSQYNSANARYYDPQNANPNRIDKSQVSGFNAAGAWKVTRGTPDVGVAILDTGIKWDNRGLRTQVRLNKGELPPPVNNNSSIEPSAVASCSAYTHTGSYDLNGDGTFNVDDYACDSGVSVTWAGRNGLGGLISGQDLIRAFSNHTDGDSNGFVDDIAGWDFFNDDNDPFDQSSYFAAHNHGTGRTEEAVERANDGDGSLGICPHCQFLPVRVWDTFVSDGDTFGLGIFYATHMGVKVIEGADGNLYHSAFTEAASQFAYKQGVTQTFSGDDLNTANHNYPGNYNHVMLIQGTVPDTVGLGQNQSNEITAQLQKFVPQFGTAAPPNTYFRSANTAQFGGHSSIAMEGPTGSLNTGKASGAAALVISAAKANGIDLTADETREILEQTAEDVLPGDTGTPATGGVGNPDPAAKGWDSHFGWGRADVGAAVAVAGDASKIPPEASIDSPDWYAPVTGTSVAVRFHARAQHATNGQFHWELQTCPTFQIGQGDGTCTKAADGDASGTFDHTVTINPQNIAQAAVPDNAGPYFDPTRTNPFKGQFTVRLVVTDPANSGRTPGVDRKILTALSDSTLRPGYPKRMGTGGEAPLRYADLNGDNVEEFLVPLEDGTLHAYEPDGSELKGWPVHTGPLAQGATHESALTAAGLATPLEPLRGAAVADLDGDGHPEVIDAAGTHLYVWNADGTLRAGFPVSLNLDFCRGEDQRQDAAGPTKPVTHRKCGFLASPALGHLEGQSKPLDIVLSALDGHVYAFRPDGTSVAHFPFDLVDTAQGANRVLAESINNPAVGDLNGDGTDDVVVASNENYDASACPDPNDGIAGALACALGTAAGGSSRVYAINGATGALLGPNWPIKLPGAIQSTLPLVGPGNDAALAKLGGAQRIVVSTTGGAMSLFDADGNKVRDLLQGPTGPGSNVPEKDPQQLNLFESASVGRLDGNGPDVVKYGITLAQAANLLLVGQNVPYEHVINAIDPLQGNEGKQLNAYPQVTDDYQFLSASNVAKVAPDSTPATPSNQILAGTGLGLLHAYDGQTGQDAPGFPKVTGGWLFAPAALSDDHRIADITREGYLFEWSAAGAPACQTEWPSFRHDDHQTGNYDADGTAPAAPGGMTVTHLSGTSYRLSFKTPGDDRFCGTATAYETEVNGKPSDLHVGTPAAGGTTVTRDITLPDDRSTVSLLARDEAGNKGIPSIVHLAPLPLCRDRAVPTLSLASHGIYGSHSRIAIRGTGHDNGCHGVVGSTRSRAGGVRRVILAVARLRHSGCQFIDSQGHLGHTRSCRIHPHFLPAQGTTSWRLELHGGFGSGNYAIRFRIYDVAGNVGRPQPIRFRIR